jgi:AcrR family transcriptional regulator
VSRDGESGFAAASLGAIAERIGVSKGVLSYHFAGKGELLHEVVARVLTEAACSTCSTWPTRVAP